MTEMTLREAREKSGLSLRKASELLGVTHPYLSALELGHKPLRPERKQQLADLYKITNSENLVQPAPQDKDEFLDWLRDQIKWWDSRFILPALPAVSKLISSIFIHPIFRHEKGDILSCDMLLKQFFSPKSDYALLIQGSVGTGKSFFMRMLTLNTEDFTNPLNLKIRYVPALVSLGELKIIPGSLVATLVAYYKQHGFSGSLLQLEVFFRQCLERGNLLLLLDGLDEVAQQSRRSELFAYIQQQYENEMRPANNKLILTGRQESFTARDVLGGGFQLARIEHWNYYQMHDAALKWSHDGRHSGEGFFQLVQAVDSLHNLAKWPLLFHLLATLYSSSGSKPFRGQAVFCETCSVVLENTWDSARHVLHSRSGLDPLADHPLLKWKHFLIFFMQKYLMRFLDGGEGLRSSFRPAEMRLAWEDFLIEKGLDRKSIDFLRLEELMNNRDRLGPMLIEQNEELDEGDLKPAAQLKFIDPIFCKYYYAKALMNVPHRIEEFVERNLRDETWQDVIPLVIEELALSDRSHESDLGKKLISQITFYDDELRLESKHKIGRFAMVCGAASVVPFNPRLHWKELIEPFLNNYLNSQFHWDAVLAHKVFGNHVTSPHIREYLITEHEKLAINSDINNQPKLIERHWRILEVLCKFGETLDYTARMLDEKIDLLRGSEDDFNYKDGILMRRIVFCIEQTGRVFIPNVGASAGSKDHHLRVKKIQSSLADGVAYAIENFKGVLKNPDKNAASFWDVTATILSAFEHLNYVDELKESLNLIYTSINDHFEELIDQYNHKENFMQFLKASFCYSHMIKPRVLNKVEKIINESLPSLKDAEKNEMRTALLCLKTFEHYAVTDDDLDNAYRKYCSEFLVKERASYVKTVKSFTSVLKTSHLELGQAVNAIRLLHRYSPGIFSPNEVVDIVKSLLKALDIEMSAEERIKDSERIYASPLENYMFPIYDHIYNTLVELSRSLPVKLFK